MKFYKFTALFIGLLALFITTGCSLNPNSSVIPNTSVAYAEVEKEVVPAVVEVDTPTEPEIESHDTEKEEAIKVAAEFAYDFFHQKDKLDPKEVGGFQYVHPDVQVEFWHFGWELSYQYMYDMTVFLGGPEFLPEVTAVYVNNVSDGEYTLNGHKFDNTYFMQVAIEYSNYSDKWNHFEEVAVSYVDGEWKITRFVAPDMYDGTAVVDTTDFIKVK